MSALDDIRNIAMISKQDKNRNYNYTWNLPPGT